MCLMMMFPVVFRGLDGPLHTDFHCVPLAATRSWLSCRAVLRDLADGGLDKHSRTASQKQETHRLRVG
jgi:hypothetical protein